MKRMLVILCALGLLVPLFAKDIFRDVLIKDGKLDLNDGRVTNVTSIIFTNDEVLAATDIATIKAEYARAIAAEAILRTNWVARMVVLENWYTSGISGVLTNAVLGETNVTYYSHGIATNNIHTGTAP